MECPDDVLGQSSVPFELYKPQRDEGLINLVAKSSVPFELYKFSSKNVKEHFAFLSIGDERDALRGMNPAAGQKLLKASRSLSFSGFVS